MKTQRISILIAFGFEQICLSCSNVFSVDFGFFFIGYFRGPASSSLSLFVISSPPERLSPKLDSKISGIKFHFWTNFTAHFTVLGTIFIRV